MLYWNKKRISNSYCNRYGYYTEHATQDQTTTPKGMSFQSVRKHFFSLLHQLSQLTVLTLPFLVFVTPLVPER